MTPDDRVPPAGATRPRATLPGWLALIAIVVFGAWVRIGTALDDPNFDRRDPTGMLRTDPALLYYFTERIVESGGAPPADFRADPRIEHPELSDWPAMETVGQEFVVAWAKLFLAPETPLHVVAVYAMGIAAAATAVGVFGLALELCGGVAWALLAALLFAVQTANYRTIGFVLIREDFSLPWFALHLWLAARAVRVRTPLAIALAALALAAALSTWHAMTFVVAVEAACVVAWYLRSGQNPLAARGGWVLPAVLVAASLLVPVLRAKWFVISLPMQALGALGVAALVERRRTLSPIARAGVALGAFVALALLAALASRALAGGLADYSHVFAFMKEKLLRLGEKPADPLELSYESRLLWQGPFQTGSWLDFRDYPFAAALLVPAAALAARGWWRGDGDGRERVLVSFALATVALAWLVQRLVVLPGMVAPVVAMALLAKARPRSIGLGLAVAGVLMQAAYFQRLVSRYQITWYHPLGVRELELSLGWIAKNVPATEPIAADYVNSAAILASAGNPVLYQPKYETLRTRRRIEEFDRAFFEGTPDDLRALLARMGTRWLFVDRHTLYRVMRYAAGIPDGAPLRAGTPAAAFLGEDARTLAGVPGFRLAYRSPPGSPLDMVRIYEVAPPSSDPGR